MSPFRYIVGIDLGTTSCALSYIDRYADNPETQTLAITQWHTQGLVEAPTLPSFCYIPKNKERESYRLPYSTFSEPYVVGLLAQERMLTHTDLVIHSAKSWLCHGGVDREAKILPWHSDTLVGDKRLSPVAVSALYLRHLKDVWNQTIAAGREEFRLEQQKIVITVPASFDELASFLTLQASELAGLGSNVVLCEEPQAAFYYWLQSEQVAPKADENILVVDIGGGTTDFCLFRNSWDTASQSVHMHRIAVSEHILLGGDNIDLALACLAENKLREQGVEKLSGQKWAQLVSECRRLKEKALQDSLQNDEREFHLSLQSASGTKLLGQTHTLSLKVSEIIQTIREGFFPDCERTEQARQRELGLKEWGLPYAEDTAVSRHLATFLAGKDVDAVLDTGGSLVPESLRLRLTALIAKWQGRTPRVLNNDAFELAVSRGASIFGFMQMRKDQRVHAGYPRSLYIKVAQGEKKLGLCIVPKGFAAHEVLELSPPGLHALLGQQASFELYSSLQRPRDHPGDLVALQELKPVSILQTRLGDASKKRVQSVPISLRIRLAASGLLELFCTSQAHEASSYRLHFSLQARMEGVDDRAGAPVALSLSATQGQSAYELVDRFFGKERLTVHQSPSSLSSELERVLSRPRKEWDVATLRALWPPLREGMNRRSRSEQHELTWFSLTGYILRPGFGERADADRIREIQPLFSQGPCFPAHIKVRNQWWIFWRRIAGGLDRKTQELIFSKAYPFVRRGEASPEMILLLGALERVDMQKKIALGQWLSSEIPLSAVYREQKIWALTRIANRLPLYGGPECVVRPSFILPWLESLLRLDLTRTEYSGLANFFANACRLIDDRELDIPEFLRHKVVEKLTATGSLSSHVAMIETYTPQDSQMLSLLLGDSLPTGLMLL